MITDKAKYLKLTKFFGKLFLINFAMGVVTGIVQHALHRVHHVRQGQGRAPVYKGAQVKVLCVLGGVGSHNHVGG